MKIIVVSDSHGEVDLLKKILQKHYDAQYFFHLGDSELPSSMMEGFLTVKGNCDYFSYPQKLEFELPVGKIYMEHGDLGKYRDTDFIKTNNFRFFFYGHTHIKKIEKVGNCYVCNPGSLTRPRDSNDGSYLLIESKENDFEFTFKNVNDLI